MLASLLDLLKGDIRVRTFKMIEDALAVFRALVMAFTTTSML
jgi:hypothetical protein